MMHVCLWHPAPTWQDSCWQGAPPQWSNGADNTGEQTFVASPAPLGSRIPATLDGRARQSSLTARGEVIAQSLLSLFARWGLGIMRWWCAVLVMPCCAVELPPALGAPSSM